MSFESRIGYEILLSFFWEMMYTSIEFILIHIVHCWSIHRCKIWYRSNTKWVMFMFMIYLSDLVLFLQIISFVLFYHWYINSMHDYMHLARAILLICLQIILKIWFVRHLRARTIYNIFDGMIDWVWITEFRFSCQ